MIVATFASFKGGAGKTTALMAAASSLIQQGKSVALFEADENRPLTKWRENALEKDAWHDQCHIFIADNEEAFEEAFNEAESKGCDIALADTHGGGSDLNNIIIVNSDFITMTTALTPLDIDEAMATYEYVVKLLKAEKLDIPTAILKIRVPVSKQTKAQQRSSELLDQLPCFTQALHDRDAFAAMKFKGLLFRTAEQLDQDPTTKLMARNYHTAMAEADSFITDILQAISEKT